MDHKQAREVGLPLARRIVRLRSEMQALQLELQQTLQTFDVPKGYLGALLFFAEYERDNLTPGNGADFIAGCLGLSEVLLTPAAQALSYEQQIELMITGRLEAATKGN